MSIFRGRVALVADSKSASISENSSRVTSLGYIYLPHLSFFNDTTVLNRLLDKTEPLSNKLRGICKEHNIEYRSSLTTNGYLLNRETAQKLKSYGVNIVQISIDGTWDVHDKHHHLENGQLTIGKRYYTNSNSY